jgi:integrase
MGVYEKNGSRFWWIWLEGQTKPFSSKIPIGTGEGRKTSKIEAEDIYRAAMGDIARGVFELPTARPRTTFRAWAAWYLEHVIAHQRGHQRCGSAVARMIEFFEDVPLHKLDAERIEEWKTWRAKAVQKPTVNRELEILKPMLQRAVGKYLEKNPAASVKRFKTKRPPIAILSLDDEQKLLAEGTLEERLMVLLGLDALLRFGDVRRLRIDQDHGSFLEIVDPKTAPYKVPVSTRLRTTLDVLSGIARERGGYFFGRLYRQRWQAMARGTGFTLFADLCERAGVTRGRQHGAITFHSLRHTGATRAARVVKLTAVRDLGGWTNLRQLDRYVHPDSGDLTRAVEAIGAGSTAAVTPDEKNGTEPSEAPSENGQDRDFAQQKRA